MKTLNLNLKRILPAIAAIFFYTGTAQAQAINTPNYNTAIGVRVGPTGGLTVKHFFATNQAFEGILGVWPNAFSVTGLYEKHVPAASLSGFRWYYGAGLHFTSYANRAYYYREGNPHYYRYRYIDAGAAIGVDGILGIEYKIPPIPFAISMDLKPYIEFHNNGNIYSALDPSLGIKFTF
jgi:outer membrane protein W